MFYLQSIIIILKLKITLFAFKYGTKNFLKIYQKGIYKSKKMCYIISE